MLSKVRILIAVGLVLSLSWDLILKVNGDLSFMAGFPMYSYLGDVRVPGAWLVFDWILQSIIIILGPYVILTMQFKKLIPKRFLRADKDLSLKFECHNCGNKYPELAKSINIKKKQLSKFCPGCGVTISTEEIVIKSTEPFSYDIRRV